MKFIYLDHQPLHCLIRIISSYYQTLHFSPLFMNSRFKIFSVKKNNEDQIYLVSFMTFKIYVTSNTSMLLMPGPIFENFV